MNLLILRFFNEEKRRPIALKEDEKKEHLRQREIKRNCRGRGSRFSRRGWGKGTKVRNDWRRKRICRARAVFIETIPFTPPRRYCHAEEPRPTFTERNPLRWDLL
jgi:hypothetical protein